MDNQSSLKGVNDVLIGVNHISTLVSVNTHNGQLRFNAEQDGSPRRYSTIMRLNDGSRVALSLTAIVKSMHSLLKQAIVLII